MNYAQTVDYLYNALPMFTRIGEAAYKKDLTNTRKLCEALGNPHTKFKSIHVAGTNGKGSTSHMLAAILQKAGYKTGLYTSPHLYDFRERIKINGEMCPETFVVDFVAKHQDIIEAIQPSFFEITVAMAFDYFAKEAIDIAVIEVGLGGRLDSTNIIEPELSVITNIGYDHMNLLGNSLEAIATEKAGIIKKNIPVVIGETVPETKEVFINSAFNVSAPVMFASSFAFINDFSFDDHLLHVEVVKHDSGEAAHYKLDLSGIYQTKNILTVLCAAEWLSNNGWKINKHIIEDALKNVKQLTGLHGRWERIHQHPDIVLDVAHNTDGIKQVLSQLEHCNYHHLHIVMGMVKDKDISTVLSLLPQNARYYFTNAHLPRALPSKDLMHAAAAFHLQGDHYDHVNDAIHAALMNANENDLIVVCGSVFVIAEVNRSLIKTAKL